MTEVTITKVFRKQEVSKKTNKPYTRLALKTKEHGERWLSGFGNKDNEHWQDGIKVSLEITESDAVDKDGNKYLNFATPKSSSGGNQGGEDLKHEIEMLKTTVGKHEFLLEVITSQLEIKISGGNSPAVGSESINTEDNSF